MKERQSALKRRIRAGVLISACLSVLNVHLAGKIAAWTDLSWLDHDPAAPSVTHLTGQEKAGVILWSFVLIFSGILWVVHKLWLKAPVWKDSMHPNRELSDAGIYGTSVFEQPWDYRPLAQIRPIEECRGIILGQLDSRGRECIDYFPDPNDPAAHINSNIFAIGASGSGKTFTVGKNYCYQALKRGHSVIITDPKGELFVDTADLYRKAGYTVRRLDFINLLKSDGWDCMKPLRTAASPEQVEITAARFAAAVVGNIGSEGIYYDGSSLLLKALLLRVVLDDSIPDGEKNILKVYSWLTDPGGAEFMDRLFDESVMPEKVRPCLQPYYSLKSSSPNLLGNIKTNLAAGIQILSTGIIANILSADDIDLTLPGKERCAYYVQFPVPNDAYKFPIALFFTMIFQSLMDLASAQDSLRLPVCVDFLLDEFAQCGVLPNWAQLTSVIRSYGLSAFMIVQTSAQFLSNYRDDADTIRSNCAIWLMLGANDLTSAEYFCRRVGKTTVKVRSESRYGLRKLLGIRNSPADRTSEGTGGSELLSTDEMMKLPPNHAVIVFQRHNPILASTVPHTLHPYSTVAEKTYDRNEPDLTDTEGRRARREKEDALRRARSSAFQTVKIPQDIDDAPYRRKPTFLSDIRNILKEDLAFWVRLCGKNAKQRPDCDYRPDCFPFAEIPADPDFTGSEDLWGEPDPAEDRSVETAGKGDLSAAEAVLPEPELSEDRWMLREKSVEKPKPPSPVKDAPVRWKTAAPGAGRVMPPRR